MGSFSIRIGAEEPWRAHQKCISLDIPVNESTIQGILEKDILLLQIARFEGLPSWPVERIYNLMLESGSGGEGTYRRVGILSMPGNGTIETGWEMKTVTII